MRDKPTTSVQANDSANKTAEAGPRGFISEYWYFLLDNKKWWLTPAILLLLLFGLVVVLGGSGAGPVIYTIF
jgi:hypothetical protein